MLKMALTGLILPVMRPVVEKTSPLLTLKLTPATTRFLAQPMMTFQRYIQTNMA
jgi:hypothetical protein